MKEQFSPKNIRAKIKLNFCCGTSYLHWFETLQIHHHLQKDRSLPLPHHSLSCALLPSLKLPTKAVSDSRKPQGAQINIGKYNGNIFSLKKQLL